MSQDDTNSPEARAQGSVGTSETLLEPITGLKLVAVRGPAESLVDGTASSSFGPPPSKIDPLVGATIDNRYKVEAVLGEGGMGVVYRCRHKIIDKKVAMKVLRADLARDLEVTERFLQEAKAASAIGDAHIIDISDFGLLPDGSTYFVMEYLDGHPLSKLVEGGQPAPITRLLHVARQLATGLAAAHEAGIVHRDLKPDNIFLIPRGGDKDFVKILDFGIAKVTTTSAGQLTRAGAVFGTPHYMSPEQAAGAPVDHRGDIYSFGVILYELACGRVPFDADNFMGILTQHMYKAPVPIRALVPPPQDIPPGLEAVILKCLSKRPEQRYASMRELVVDIEELREGRVPGAVAEMMARSGGFNVPADFFKVPGRMPAPVPASPLGGERPKWPLIAGAAGVIVAVGLVVAIFAQSAESPAASSAGIGAERAPATEAAPQASSLAPPPSKRAEVSVAIAIEPFDADVTRDGVSLGTSPVVLAVTPGSPIELEARRKGHVSRTFTLDGTEPKVMIRLEREKVATVAAARPARPASKPAAREPAPRPKPKSGLGGGEIVNPWAR